MVKEKMNRKTQVQGQAPDVTTSTPPVAARADTVGVYRAAVERKAQQIFGPKMMGSDLAWDLMGLAAGRYWRLYPLRDRVQAIARKYRNRPAIFYREFHQILVQRDRKLAKDPSEHENIVRYKEFLRRVDEALALAMPSQTVPKRTPGLPSFPEHFTPRQVEAVDLILHVMEAPLIGQPPAETNPKRFINAFKSLAALPAGRQQKGVYRKGLEILRSGKYPERPYHHICLELDPSYTMLRAASDGSLHPPSDVEQAKIRKAMKAGIRRLMKKKHIKLPEYRQRGTKPPR